MAHSRIWERENQSCYYEKGQLDNMILAWEPGYTELSINDFDFALGIYTEKYFTPSFYGRVAYSHTIEENSISLLNLRSIEPDGYFSFINGERLTVHYEFNRKLWEGNNRQLMHQVDMDIINAKMQEFDHTPRTTYNWPLSFTVNTENMRRILNTYGINNE